MALSFIESPMYNGDNTRYGTAYFFFPETEGFPVANPSEFKDVSEDIWNQILIKKFASLEEAQEYEAKYQQDI